MPGRYDTDPGVPFHRRLSYHVASSLIHAACKVLYRVRVTGADHMPESGPVLVVANHQSYLDPPLIGSVLRRRHCWFIARAGLFKSRLFAWLISWFNSIPISEEGSDTKAIKLVIGLLAADRVVLIFPEGSRTNDGAMTEFKRGAAVLVKRAKCPVLPVAIEGCHDAWPRGRAAPRLFGCRAAMRVAAPISSNDLFADGPDEAMRRLERDIDAMRLELRQELRERSTGRFPPPGPGDRPFRRGTG